MTRGRKAVRILPFLFVASDQRRRVFLVRGPTAASSAQPPSIKGLLLISTSTATSSKVPGTRTYLYIVKFVWKMYGVVRSRTYVCMYVRVYSVLGAYFEFLVTPTSYIEAARPEANFN